MFIQVSTRNLGGPVPCDNVKLYINGQQVRPAYDVPAGHMTTVYSVRPHLKQGSNQIAVEVVNLMSPGAVNLDILAVNKGNGKDKFQRFGSNESWRTFDKAAEGWTQLDFNDAAWRRAALRGQATPGSFCRLPYRFMGTAGTVKLSGVAFPKEISTDRQYRLTAEVALNAEDGYPGVTGGATLFFQLINSSMMKQEM
jgi:hypothetical protein